MTIILWKKSNNEALANNLAFLPHDIALELVNLLICKQPLGDAIPLVKCLLEKHVELIADFRQFPDAFHKRKKPFPYCQDLRGANNDRPRKSKPVSYGPSNNTGTRSDGKEPLYALLPTLASKNILLQVQNVDLQLHKLRPVSFLIGLVEHETETFLPALETSLAFLTSSS